MWDMGWAEGMATASCLYAASSYETHVGIIGLACTACECVRHQGACFRNIKSTVVFQRYESTPQDMGGMYEILGGIFLIFRFWSFFVHTIACANSSPLSFCSPIVILHEYESEGDMHMYNCGAILRIAYPPCLWDGGGKQTRVLKASGGRGMSLPVGEGRHNFHRLYFTQNRLALIGLSRAMLRLRLDILNVEFRTERPHNTHYYPRVAMVSSLRISHPTYSLESPLILSG